MGLIVAEEEEEDEEEGQAVMAAETGSTEAAEPASG